MEKPVRPDEPITIGERIATAFVSAIAAGLTVAAYFVILLAFSSRSYGGPPKTLFDAFFSRFSIGFVVAAFIIGFALGSARMATVFGSLWGTNEEEDDPWVDKLKAVVAVVMVVLVATHLTHSS